MFFWPINHLFLSQNSSVHLASTHHSSPNIPFNWNSKNKCKILTELRTTKATRHFFARSSWPFNRFEEQATRKNYVSEYYTCSWLSEPPALRQNFCCLSTYRFELRLNFMSCRNCILVRINYLKYLVWCAKFWVFSWSYTDWSWAFKDCNCLDQAWYENTPVCPCIRCRGFPFTTCMYTWWLHTGWLSLFHICAFRKSWFWTWYGLQNKWWV